MKTRLATLSLAASALVCVAGCSEVPRTPDFAVVEDATFDISGDFYMLRHGFTSAADTVPFASDLPSTQFTQHGNSFSQAFGDDPGSAPIPGTVSGETYTQGDAYFSASFTMLDAASGAGSFDGSGLAFDFELARKASPPFDVAGDFVRPGESGVDVRVDVTDEALDVTIDGVAYTGVQAGSTGLLLPRDPAPNTSGAAILRFDSAGSAEVTVFSYSWTASDTGHSDFARDETSFRVSRPGQPSTCTTGEAVACRCDDGRVSTQTCSDAGEYGACDCPSQPIDCQVSEFSEWSACSQACDGGSRTRTRVVTQAAADGGAGCPALGETETCNPQECTTSYYQVVRQAMTWDQARDHAVTLRFAGVQGHLVTIGSSEEQGHIAGLMEATGGPVWLGAMQVGATEQTPRTNWEWVTGESMEYDNFAAGEPNDAGGEDYLMGWGDGTWNDASTGANTVGFIVEYDVPASAARSILAVPTPTAVTFSQARESAELWSREGQRGGLADIDSNEEQVALEHALDAIGASMNFWIGGWQHPGYAPTERWTRMDGSDKHYFNWLSGEPNDASGAEDYLLTFPSGLWIDTNHGGYNVGGYVLEF